MLQFYDKGEGIFALIGATQDRILGLIQIAPLNFHFAIHIHKLKEGISRDGSHFILIKELQPETIFLAGD